MSPELLDPTHESVREAVREHYAAAATASLLPVVGAAASCCGGAGCCGASASGPTDPISRDLYEGESSLEGAVAASLGCGNPTALVELHPGQDVLDLGSGGGLDVLLSARRVGPGGTAYGLDMTPEMLELARRHQAEAGVENAEFLHGTIENIPLPDASVDVVISNCVINLSPDKDAVLREAFRVIRPGGRFAVSDIVLVRDIPAPLGRVVALWTGCISGALRDTEYADKLAAAGFADASVEVTRRYPREDLLELAGDLDAPSIPDGMTLAEVVDALDGAFASAFVRATRPPA